MFLVIFVITLIFLLRSKAPLDSLDVDKLLENDDGDYLEWVAEIQLDPCM